MCRFTIIAASFLIYEQTVFSVTVDQRQTGDMNVQIDLKNLKIVGLMNGKEEYVDYDYAYDYSEMTIKPPKATTKKPLNVTPTIIKDNATASMGIAELDHTTTSPQTSSLSSDQVVTTALNTSISTVSAITPQSQDSDNTTTTTTESPSCKKGFFRNSKGNCELKLQNPSNALLKMIKQKLRLNGGNGLRRL